MCGLGERCLRERCECHVQLRAIMFMLLTLLLPWHCVFAYKVTSDPLVHSTKQLRWQLLDI